MYLPRPTLGTSLLTAHQWLLAALLGVAVAAAAPEARSESADTVARHAAGAEYSEDEVKAAFLFHFATYAEWPRDAAEAREAVTFAVLHAPSIARELARFSEGRTINGRPVRVRRIRSIAQVDGAEVLFIGASQNRRLAQLVGSVEGPTLVVTDSEHGLPEGAMINFQLVDRRVRFEIALPAAQRVGLSLSSRLLSAAMRVEMSRCYLECRVLDAEGGLVLGAVAIRTTNPA